jgi:hypothetical protein
MPRKKRNFQYQARRTVYAFHQYWNIHYTERYQDGSEKDFKTFIKAKSYESAKEILHKRTKETDPSIKIKALHGFMFHQNYKPVDKPRIRIQEWDQIRKAAFPNQHNVLFKYEVERDPSKSNRFNETDYDHLKTIGFKSGEDNWSTQNMKGKILPLSKRSHMIYKGKWVPWDRECRNNTRQEIIDALILNGNVRMKAAEHLNISRNKLYKLMSRFPEIDWDKQYSAPKPFSTAKKPDPKVLSEALKKSMKERMENGEIPFKLTPEQVKKRDIGRQRAYERQRKEREERLKGQIELIKDALPKNDNKRNKTAEYLGWKSSYLSKVMRLTRHVVNWSTEYPNSSIAKRYL